MDASDNQSDGECAHYDSDRDFDSSSSDREVRLKKEPGPWIARNPGRLSKVDRLILELLDQVYTICEIIGDLLNLKLLIIKRGFFSQSLSQLPSNLGNLSALRILSIRNCGIKSLPHTLSLIYLTHLELNNCVFIQELPASLYVKTLTLLDCNVKSFSAKPHYLRALEINNCLYVNDILTSLNHFDTLHTLQHLEIKDCMNLKRLPQNLSRLTYLTLINCGLESIPSGLRSLTSLSIRNCPMEFLVIKESVSLAYLYIEKCPMEFLVIKESVSLTYLYIEKCPMEFLVIKESVSLTSVTIKSCNIKSLDGCITGLTKLKRLSIQDCVALKGLPTDINTLVSLQRLWIEGCTSIKFLPSLPALHNLYSLSLKSCSGLDELPADLDELTKLRFLNLTNTNVQSLPSAIAKLFRLKNIQLPWCFRLETLPNDFDLKRIKVYLPRSFRLDTLPAKFFAKKVLGTAYRLRLRDHKESSLECDVDVDNADDSSGYLQAMVNAPAEQVLAGTPGYLDEGRSSPPSAFQNLGTGRNHMGFAHNGDGPSKQIEASEYLRGKDQHIMNYSRVMSQRGSRDSESIDSTSRSVTSKALSKEVTSLLRTKKRTMDRATDDGHRMKQRKSQLGTSEGRCESMLSSTQDKMYKVWAKYKESEINFKFKAESSFAELKQELAERLQLEGGKLKIKYLDAPENLGKGDSNASIVRDWVLMTCDADLRYCERFSLGMKIWLSIQENQDLAARSNPLPLVSTTFLGTIYQEHLEHLHSSSTLVATQIGQVNGVFMENSSVEAPDGRLSILAVKATYKDDIIKFDLLSTSSLAKLKEEVLLRLPLEENKIKIKYQDEEDDWVLLACPRDLQHCLRLSTSRKSNIIRLMIFDS